jgi:putative transposase
MTKLRDYELQPDELAIIEQAMASDKRPEVRERATALRLLHLGFAMYEVAEMLNIRRSTLYYWRVRWQESGLEGLANKPKSGRPRKADAVYCQQLETVLEQDPAALGYPFHIWTVDRLRAHLAQLTGISLSHERFRDVMKRQGYVYRRPKKSLAHLQDKAARDEAKAWLDAVKKEPHSAISSSSLWTKRR